MVEFKIKVYEDQRLAYIPKEVVETLGTRLKMKPDQYAAVIYPEGAKLDLVVRSVEIILEYLKLKEVKVDG
ncbi:MAG: hypothetical protein QXD04_04365 [Candidatus Bathyarchaeia archaeon]